MRYIIQELIFFSEKYSLITRVTFYLELLKALREQKSKKNVNYGHKIRRV